MREIPVIAIGASAGGLQPIEEFFVAAPTAAGWCFVVTQHLSPDFRSMMDKLLARKTSLTIRHIEDGVAVAPNTIFLCKPNEEAVLENGRFRTRAYESSDNLPQRPIDTFIGSLVGHSVTRCFAIILSGSGSDGVKGAKAFSSAGGHVIVQTPRAADFPSMPRAMIEAGVVDQVLDASEMPDAIRDIMEIGAFGGMSSGRLSIEAQGTILEMLDEHYGVDFEPYRPKNVARRILRRQHLRGCATIEDYMEELNDDAAARDELFSDLLIGVTAFYRDPEAIMLLRSLVIKPLLKDCKAKDTLRIWVPGCATGEEAYTIAIEVAEAIREANIDCQFRVLATDIDRRSLEVASAGVYDEDAVSKIPSKLRSRYFIREGSRWLIAPELRKRTIFSTHNVLTDPPFLDIDLVSCRNLLIYLRDKAQSVVLSMFLFALRQHGFLFLGPSESLGASLEDFSTVDTRWRLFQKTTNPRKQPKPFSVVSNVRKSIYQHYPEVIERERGRVTKPLLQDVADIRSRETLIRSYDILLKRFAPSSILITSDGDVLSWFGAAAAFVDTMNNLADLTVEGVVHPDLHFVVNVGIERLRNGEFKSISRKVEVDLGKDRLTPCTVTLEAIETKRNPRLLLVGIRLDEDTVDEALGAAASPEPTGRDDQALLTGRIRELERDLKLTEETLQHVTERLEASGEELQASNEELQASNEELQASNEELQASNEELHAVNEELISLGAQHEKKLELFTELQSDTEHLLGAMKVGLVVVAEGLRVLRFSDLIEADFELEAHDLGRSLYVIGPRFDDVNLAEEVERTIASGEARLISGTRSGHNYEVEISPVAANPSQHSEARAMLVFRNMRGRRAVSD